jgi:hypothetical protein
MYVLLNKIITQRIKRRPTSIMFGNDEKFALLGCVRRPNNHPERTFGAPNVICLTWFCVLKSDGAAEEM